MYTADVNDAQFSCDCQLHLVVNLSNDCCDRENAARRDCSEPKQSFSHLTELKGVACGILAAWAVTAASPVIAANLVGGRIPFH